MERKEYIIKELSNNGLEVSKIQASQLVTLYDRMIEVNEVMNLTRITEFAEVVEKHYIDSLLLTKYADLSEYRSLLDLGSGAGFPGLPLAIFYPGMDITLVDSVGKKVHYLEQTAEALDLPYVEAVHARAEDLAHDDDYREQFGICTSRAVANLSTLAEYCLPFVEIGGLFAAYKSGDSEEEIRAAKQAIHTLGGKIESKENYNLGDAGRTLVLIRKVRETPKRYPRKAGLPSKSPIR